MIAYYDNSLSGNFSFSEIPFLHRSQLLFFNWGGREKRRKFNRLRTTIYYLLGKTLPAEKKNGYLNDMKPYYDYNRKIDRRPYILPSSEWRRLQLKAYHAQQQNHLEVCGVLVTGLEKRIKLWFLHNCSKQPYHYALNMTDFRTIQNLIANQNQHLLGSFHSHPISEAVPGPGDLEKAFFKGVELIYDVCGEQAKLWSVKKCQGVLIAKELPLICEPCWRKPFDGGLIGDP